MDIKVLFAGKRKFLAIPVIIIIGLIFLPITIGLLLTWFSYKKIGNKKVKYSAASLFALITLFFGSAYVSALVSPTLKSENKVAQVEISPTQAPTSTIEPEVAAATDEAQDTDLVKVTRVIDGDTIELEGGQRVRYIGIDTPELSGKVECFGREAYDKNRELVEGKEIRLEKDVSETDRYGRLLRYVYVGDSFINDVLVRTGYANASSYPPDIKYQEQFREAEREAREANKGLWSSCSTQATATPKPTNKPTIAPKQNSGSSTAQPVSTTSPQQNTGGSYSCNCSRTCTQITSCAEAQYQLNVCGCKQRDADDDGIACDGAPLNCQN